MIQESEDIIFSPDNNRFFENQFEGFVDRDVQHYQKCLDYQNEKIKEIREEFIYYMQSICSLMSHVENKDNVIDGDEYYGKKIYDGEEYENFNRNMIGIIITI
jgi:hypothetical protein